MAKQVEKSENALRNGLTQDLMTVPSATPSVVAVRGITKKQTVIDMCKRDCGTTVADIAQTLLIGKVAARSLIGDVRHAKITVECINGVYRIR